MRTNLPAQQTNSNSQHANQVEVVAVTQHINHISWCDTRTRINIQWKQEIPKVSAAQSCENQLKISLIIS